VSAADDDPHSAGDVLDDPDGDAPSEPDGQLVPVGLGDSDDVPVPEPLGPEPLDPLEPLEPELLGSGAGEELLGRGVGCVVVGLGCGEVGFGDGSEPPPDPVPTGLPGSTGGSDGLCFGGPCRSGVVGSTGTVMPTAPLAYTFSRPITIET
jgi:hypothetical protein